MFIQIYSYLILELKYSNENMITKIKNNNFGYENKTFQRSKCSSLMFHSNSMFYNDTISSSFLNIQNSPMFYSNSNIDKNY
jgi:hypothetical protein